ncbi:sulfur transferase domain-containing protein [Dolichospermum circinale CS-1225]|uniref:beta-lactamase hydrolase domain-containing protein n=1 Tax=Dolichospermum circinale TaxID=109265 RepID=UPI000401BFAA|nr:sulfur transferase domain-containing protein [Dolichospermum circinale]MDB9457967.1 sulfur transferase domain-containing protein [Dolichospermum circinale CS-545/17]MDB9468166.1 sulfur transferase domain-containing protein [Dolichospermum circinale CS-539/09]MDB9470198.1 sulfur transferase domain-containing protein [Dolichospermum circinale CS-539]MDB9522567.1 sulfur transferase domain-containing protein [Dolichospermum circinale CS-1225]
MTNFKKVSDNLSIAGQISSEELKQLARGGFKSVLNLRSPDENGFFDDEKQEAQIVGLEYTNIPLNSQAPNPKLTAEAIQAVENLPKPILIHCAGGARAGGIALIANAIQAGLSYQEIVQKANELGINLEQPHLKQFLLEKFAARESYL